MAFESDRRRRQPYVRFNDSPEPNQPRRLPYNVVEPTRRFRQGVGDASNIRRERRPSVSGPPPIGAISYYPYGAARGELSTPATRNHFSTHMPIETRAAPVRSRYLRRIATDEQVLQVADLPTTEELIQPRRGSVTSEQLIEGTQDQGDADPDVPPSPKVPRWAPVTYDKELSLPGPQDEAVYGEPVGDYFAMERPVSPALEDLDVFDDFKFVFPQAEPSKDGDISDLEVLPTETDSGNQGDSNVSLATKIPGVYSSRYTGSAELGGSHLATLSILHDPKGQKQLLFRWVHIQQDIMNFDEFWSEIGRQVRFSEEERNAIARLRADVKRQCVKSRYNPKGVKVGYMDPRCMQVPFQTSKKDQSSEDSRKVTWICLPYFSLQAYAGLLLASNTALFPAQTLLQSQYSRSTEQRDMEQAVCKLQIAPDGECFHVSQLWCIVIDNSFLLTCGTMPQVDLQADDLKIVREPSQSQNGKILVSYGSTITWSLPTKDCQTWFAFISHFYAFWPRAVEFRRKSHILTAKSWPKLLKVAEGPRGSIQLTLRIIQPLDIPKSFPKPQGTLYLSAPSEKKDQSPKAPVYLHVLTLLPGDLKSGTQEDIDKNLNEQLAAADKFLSEQTSYSSQRGYRKCDVATRESVDTYLKQAGIDIEEKKSDTLRRGYEDRVDIFNAANTLFQLFFPLTFEGPTVRKFWGSLNNVMKILDLKGDASFPFPPSMISEVKGILCQMSDDVQAFESIMAYAGEKEREVLELPHEFVTAWLHIVSGVICCSHIGDWAGHMFKARNLIQDGMQKLIQSISSGSLLDLAAMMPMEVVSLISLNLLKDQVGKLDDISDTYSQYLSSLDTDITTKPTDRSYQHKIDFVQQEMTAIKKTVAKQKNVIATLRYKTSTATGDFTLRTREDIQIMPRRGLRERDYYADPTPAYPGTSERPYDRTGNEYDTIVDDQFLNDIEAASKLSPTDPGGFRSLFLADCAGIIDQKEFEFRKNTEYAEDLEREINYKMEWTKDRQENAIYAFTLVTIIFLPISAISSIFGMNTSDVRNMEFNQWLYWVVALPVTILVIIVGLWWMNELGNVFRWMSGKKSIRYSAPGEAALVPQPPLLPEPQTPPPESVNAAGWSQKTAPIPQTYVTRPTMGSGPRRRRHSFYRY